MFQDKSESILSPDNLSVLEEKYQEFLDSPGSVDPRWQEFFAGIADSESDSLRRLELQKDQVDEADAGINSQTTDLHMRVIGLMQEYRRHGHFSALTDPLHPDAHNKDPLTTAQNRFSPAELQTRVSVYLAGQLTTITIAEVIERMQKIYCSTMGTEFYYIRNDERRRWLIEHIESKPHLAKINPRIKSMIYEKLYAAESFEKFIAMRYPGKKRFSLEGGESLIPTLGSLVENAGSYNIEQIVIGMAHRGRLNVLANVMGKDTASIFAEFDENISHDESAGDVKYHMGYSSDVNSIAGGKVHLSLAFNPSHLEVINPVVLGSVRARQARNHDHDQARHLPVLIHGDAAFAGQGINYECLNMANLVGYSVGGTVHIIVNNQIGFTTDPGDSRSTPYCTDLAKMLQTPVFHVNGNDPEACYRAIQLCLEWRQKFKTDVFLDLICYRRWGHNETDEPSFTQPGMYSFIKKLATTPALYEQRLLAEGFDKTTLDTIKDNLKKELESAYDRLQNQQMLVEKETLSGPWSGFQKANALDPETALPLEQLQRIGTCICTTPDGFTTNRKIARLLENRSRMLLIDGPHLDWGMAELLAYGSVLADNYPIRLSGQDCRRGTFSHRHATIFDAHTDKGYTALEHINPDNAPFEIVNSLLSEMGVLGFEFGYSLADPRSLVIWEAQFGDFVNSAQVIVDQFISSCETKWNRMSGLVLLLPHGYEGQGPEHSSARLERFLELCSQNNIQVVYPTTPAQYFHLIRRQILRNFRKPLIIMSPKSLLRLPAATSPIQELSKGTFQNVIDDPDPAIQAKHVDRLLLCSGKIYYDLATERAQKEISDIALVRVEQIYPYPVETISNILEKYDQAKEICWVQEEPRNQGAWIYMENRLNTQIHSHQDLRYFGRNPSPSPATGYFKVHQREQSEIIELSLRTKSY